MAIIHIANIDTSIIGGVQTAVPQMVRSQSKYTDVGFINTYGDIIDGVNMLANSKIFEISSFPEPFNKPELVIFHELYRFEFINIGKTLKKANIPYIVIPHGCLSRQAQRRKFLKKAVANAVFFSKFLRAAASIQYLSENEARLSAFKKYQYFISGNGIFLPQKKKDDFFQKGMKFVYIGRLEIKTKGLDLLLEAVKLCCETMRQAEAHVEIYGPDSENETEELKKMSLEYGISDIVSIGGKKLGKEKEELLLSSDCFIQTSRTEGLPAGPLEAMGYGIPCIVTDGVGLGGLVESYAAGYRCSTTALGIADAICRFIKEGEHIGTFSESAVKLVKENFDIDVLARKTIEEYRKIKSTY